MVVVVLHTPANNMSQSFLQPTTCFDNRNGSSYYCTDSTLDEVKAILLICYLSSHRPKKM